MASEFLSTPVIHRYYFTQHLGLRTVTDGATATSTALTSATANFVAADVGATVTGSGIPGATTIASVTNATTVVLSASTTATAGSVSVTIARTNTLGLSSFQTAINADFASYFTTVPQLFATTAAPSVALLIVSPTLVLSINPGQWIGFNYGNWQVLANSVMAGSVFTPAPGI